VKVGTLLESPRQSLAGLHRVAEMAEVEWMIRKAMLAPGRQLRDELTVPAAEDEPWPVDL
jgi:hypothetical protein